MKIKYHYNRAGLAAFADAVLDEALRGDYHPIEIKIGIHNVEIPIYPETFEVLELLLNTAMEVEEE